MTAEEKRERLLKRMLPALIITVIYFVFVSSFISEQKDKAEEEYTQLVQKGVDPAVISGINRQMTQSLQKITELTQKQQAQQDKIKKMAGFIVKTEASNDASTLLAKILANNDLLVTHESSMEVDDESLNPAVKEIKQWLQPAQAIKAQHLEIQGSYFSMMKALAKMKALNLQAVPLVFNMKGAEDQGATLIW